MREPVELAVESEPRAVNSAGPFAPRLGELPRDRDIIVTCRSGERAYNATRVLLQHGFKARMLAGGMLSRTHAATFWTS